MHSSSHPQGSEAAQNKQSTSQFSLVDRPNLISEPIIDWAKKRYRSRTFYKDDRVPTRAGLLYLVQKGFIRLAGNSDTAVDIQKSSSQISRDANDSNLLPLDPNSEGTSDVSPSTSILSFSEEKTQKKRGRPKKTGNLESGEINSSSKTAPLKFIDSSEEETFLGFLGLGEPFELLASSPFTFKAYAHTDETTVIWMYWEDLDNWPMFRRDVLDAFRYQNQRKLVWLSTLAQSRSIDRLYGVLRLLIEEYGEPWVSPKNPDVLRGYRLPLSLSQIQIASLIASSRVTVIRTIAQLREQGSIDILDDNSFFLPVEQDI